ncbi:MAG TPA: hypothetical protein VKR58_15400, partial [Aquella sp.]|nr:hypothetical protein [Aquella sp.]
YILRTAGILQNVQVVYSYYIWNNYIGLAIFTTADYAANFVAVQNQKNPGCISGMQAVSVGIDLARDIGLNSPLGINGERVVCLLLCDRPDSPEIMWLDYTKDNLDDGKYNVLGDILND